MQGSIGQDNQGFAPATGLTLNPEPAPTASAQPLEQMDVEDPQAPPRMSTLDETVGETLVAPLRSI